MRRYLTKDEERALADPRLGRAFKMALINDATTDSDKAVFRVVAEKMLKWSNDDDLRDIESFAGVDMKDPFFVPEWARNLETPNPK
jgi:hypothetical protein